MKKPRSGIRSEVALSGGVLFATIRGVESNNGVRIEKLVMKQEHNNWLSTVSQRFGQPFAEACRQEFTNWSSASYTTELQPDFLQVLQGTILELQVPLTTAQLINYGQSFFLQDVSETLTDIVRRNCMSDARILPVEAVQMVMQTLSQWVINHPEPELFVLTMYLGYGGSFAPADSATTPAK